MHLGIKMNYLNMLKITVCLCLQYSMSTSLNGTSQNANPMNFKFLWLSIKELEKKINQGFLAITFSLMFIHTKKYRCF